MNRLARIIPAPLRRRLEVFLIDRGLPPSRARGAAGIAQLGHRGYVGADSHYEAVGRRQFEFMLEHGLAPEHVFCDVGCGSLRGGRHFIGYLQPGHYLGLEGERELVERAVAAELDPAQVAAKRPEFVFSYDYEFGRFTRSPRFALAVSVFSHLTAADIRRCLTCLAAHVTGPCEFFASYFEVERPVPNFQRSHPHLGFYYTREQMEGFAREAGWVPTSIGEWGSPSRQPMMKFSIGR